jgi:hypothetical protein
MCISQTNFTCITYFLVGTIYFITFGITHFMDFVFHLPFKMIREINHYISETGSVPDLSLIYG